MKAKIIFLVIFSLSVSFTFGQLKVVSSGNVGLGTSTPASRLGIGFDGYTGYSVAILGFTGGNYYRAIQAAQPVGTDITYTTYGITGSVTSGSGGSKLLGVYGTTYRGTTPTSARTYGVYGLAGNGIDGGNFGIFGTISGSRNGIGVYGSTNWDEPNEQISQKWAGYFKGDVRVYGDLDVDGVCSGSDINLKKEIAPVNADVLSKLAELQTIKFKLKHPSEMREISDTVDMAMISEEMKSERYTRVRLGLIAQELQVVFPEVVKEKSNGYLAVRYTELIPILVRAINQQQKQIEILESQFAIQKSSNVTQSLATTIDDLNSGQFGFETLEQNVPNPFNENTIIKYSIPSLYSQAMINVYDLQGSQLMSYKLNQLAEGEIMIPGSELRPGIFIYNLIADGIELASRRMILTE